MGATLVWSEGSARLFSISWDLTSMDVLAKLLQRKVLLVALVSKKLSCRSEIPREHVFRERFHSHERFEPVTAK